MISKVCFNCGKAFQVRQNKVRFCSRECGYIGRTKKNDWTVNEDNILLENYPSKGIDFCIKLLPNRSKKAIQGRLTKKLKILLNADYKSKVMSDRFSKTNIQVEKFLTIDAKETAYIIGFLWADGYSNRDTHVVSLKINSDDAENIKTTFAYVGKWNLFIQKHPKWKETTTFFTGNKRLYDFLQHVGFKEKSKKSPGELMQLIPTDLHKYFFRGLVDGDGCFYIKKSGHGEFTITSTLEQDWTYCENYFSALGVNYKIYRTNKDRSKSSQIKIMRQSDLIKLGDEIYSGYENDKIGLDRKYKKFKIIKSYGN